MIKNNLIKIVILASILLYMFSNNFVLAVPSRYDREEQLNQEQWQQVQEDKYNSGLQDPTANPDSWAPTIEDDSTLAVKAGTVLGFINVIGVISAVIILVVIGIKYMIGSLEEKAEYKKAMIPYLIGIFLLVAATSIPNIIGKIINTEGFFG